MADTEQMFPRQLEIFDPVVTKVLNAAASGMMNDYQATASEQVHAQRLLMQCSPEQCSWAADAVEYLLEAGSYAHIYDSTVLPNVVDELKNSEVNRDLVRLLLTRTDIDQVRACSATESHTNLPSTSTPAHYPTEGARSKRQRMVLKSPRRRSSSQVLSEHGLPGSPPKTSIREHLHLTAPDDCMFFYGVEAPVKYDIEGRPILPADLTDFERAMCVVPEGRGDPGDAGKAIGPQETAAQRLNETLPRERGLKTASGRPVGSSSSSSAEKRQKGDPAT